MLLYRAVGGAICGVDKREWAQTQWPRRRGKLHGADTLGK